SMHRAHELIADNTTIAQAGTAVGTAVACNGNSSPGSIDHQRQVQEPSRDWPLGDLMRKRDRVPEARENVPVVLADLTSDRVIRLCVVANSGGAEHAASCNQGIHETIALSRQGLAISPPSDTPISLEERSRACREHPRSNRHVRCCDAEKSL